MSWLGNEVCSSLKATTTGKVDSTCVFTSLFFQDAVSRKYDGIRD